ncbi:MAG: hypothetical protein ACKVTZ_21500 [Bacteroidia bacterium]
MKQNGIYLTDLHHDHQEWLIALDFYKHALKGYGERLDDVARANTKVEVMKQVEHYQNQFIIQEKNISDLVHLIAKEENIILSSVKENPVATDHRKITDNVELREAVTGFENYFTKLRTEYIRFLRSVL